MTRFLLSNSDRTLRCDGVRERYDDVAAASRAVTEGRVRLVAGALPFDPRTAAELIVPETAEFSRGPARFGPLRPLPNASILAETPDCESHVGRVAELVSRIRGGDFRKVVAARSVRLEFDDPIDPMLLAAHLIIRNPEANGFVVDSTGCGGRDVTLVGVSPEMLISKQGLAVSLRPLAGTTPRHRDPETDRRQGEALLSSMKNREEHSYVIEWIRERLAPVCRELSIPRTPELVSTPEVWHLASPITGVLSDPAMTVLDLAALLQPTPALCGVPTDLALETITSSEDDRGLYGGAVGWCDSHGDGTWVVAIRCIELDAGRLGGRAFAGGGIVAASDPYAEWEETVVKLRTVLGTFDIRQDFNDAAFGAQEVVAR
ncbi:isochorismate synthase MenF [Nocardia sp. NPDC006044]|uniref:isochorismate synthase n=1 Tax=Nocardia sp. NPDC006044 TaxID=3364306 RepID=UPI0036AB1F66